MASTSILGVLALTLALALPIGALVFFVVSLVLFLNGRNRDDLTDAQRKTRRTMLIVSSIVLGVLLLLIAGVITLFMVAISFM